MDLIYGKCNQSLRSETNKIQCIGFCKKLFHGRKCLNLTDYNIKLIMENNNINFTCDMCLKNFEVLQKSYEDILLKINENNISLANSVEEKVEKIFNSVRNLKRDIIDEIKTKPSANEVKNKGSMTYAQQLKLPVIVKPKEKTQNSSETIDDIKSKINPSALSIKVNNIQELKNNGAISINCVNKQSVETIGKEIKNQFGDSYEVQIPNLRNPKILVVGMSEELGFDKIIESIKVQNNFSFKVIKCNKVYRSFKNKSVFNAIIEVDGNAFDEIMKDGKLNIEWDRCKVYESISVLRCHKCLGFNHKASDCTIGSCCYKCGEKDHIAKECNSMLVKCLNCCRAKESLGLHSLDVKHDSKSVECPMYKRKLNNLKNKIMY